MNKKWNKGLNGLRKRINSDKLQSGNRRRLWGCELSRLEVEYRKMVRCAVMVAQMQGNQEEEI
tara:strand:+ start:10888 stop:11076 length:189 start_codon:yes stop_codon:yes gene_type:complete